jgi:hypothetical protein
MYLVSPEYLNANNTELPSLVSKEAKMPPLRKKRSNKKSKLSIKKKNATKRSIDRWVKLRAILQEADLQRKKEIWAVADFLKKVLHMSVLPTTQAIRQSLPTTTLLYEAPEIGLKYSPNPIDVKHETTTPPGTEKRVDGELLEFGELASPYVYKRGFLDTTYGIRKVGDTFMIGDSPVDVNVNSNIHIKKQEFQGTKGLWELLTRESGQETN